MADESELTTAEQGAYSEDDRFGRYPSER